VEVSRLRSALSVTDVSILEKAQLLHVDGQRVSSPFRAHVMEDLLIFTDPDVPSSQQSHAYLDPLWEAPHLSRLLVRGRAANALDMGCGCGVLSLILASMADTVIGVDLNPRAVAMSRFNAALNGIRNVEFMEGDLFGPVPASRFDRLVFNSPTADEGDRYVSLLQAGERILRRFLESVPERLSPHGYAQLNLAVWDAADDPVSAKLPRWLGPRAHQYRLLLLTLTKVMADGGRTLRRGWLSIRHGAGGMIERPYDYVRLARDPHEGSAMIVAALDSHDS
jgi:SAM-dependent methyltransferase